MQFKRTTIATVYFSLFLGHATIAVAGQLDDDINKKPENVPILAAKPKHCILKKDETIVLRYRILHVPGGVNAESLDEEYQKYITQ